MLIWDVNEVTAKNRKKQTKWRINYYGGEPFIPIILALRYLFTKASFKYGLEEISMHRQINGLYRVAHLKSTELANCPNQNSMSCLKNIEELQKRKLKNVFNFNIRYYLIKFNCLIFFHRCFLWFFCYNCSAAETYIK